jgi:cytoskeleton protein RodZ
MESIGERLQSARDQKGYSLEQAARETHIAKRYLEAIEAENFDEVPAEPYLVGFLRSYSEYLDLDPQETVGLYRNMKLQEQPPPIDQLIEPKKPIPLSFIIIVLLAAALIGGIVLLFSQGYFTGVLETSPPEERVTAAEHRFTEEFLEQRFSQGDRIRMQVSNLEYSMTVTEISDLVVLETPAGAWELSRTEESLVDVTNDGQEDLKILVRDLAQNDSPPTVVLRFDRVVASPGENGVVSGNGDEAELPLGSTLIASRQQSPRVITERSDRTPFTVMVEFTAPVLFRYLIDGTEKQQEFFQGGQSLSVTARRSIRVWSSNAGATRMQVADTSVPLGSPGENSVALIRYRGTQENQTELELVPVY